MEFVRVNGTVFEFRGEEIRFRGLGIGSWLNMEHFMLGIPTPESMIKEAFLECFDKERQEEFFDRFVTAFVREEDFSFLKKLGINLVRVPFNYHWFLDEQEPEKMKETGFRYFDRLLSFCRKYEIFLMPDLHAVPGGENPDWHSDNRTGIPQFWHYRAFQEQMVFLWQEFARRYKNETWILGYDLLNEPCLMPKQKGLLQAFYQRVTKAVRAVDPNHILLLEGDFFAMDVSELHEITDEQTAVTFHFYPTVWDERLDKAEFPRGERRRIFAERFCEMTEKMRRFHRPLLCGEAGYEIRGNEITHVMEMTEDTLELFETYEVSWTLWCYKDARFMGLTGPKEDSLWMKFAAEIGQYWNHHDEMKQGRRIVEQLAKEFPGEVSEELLYQLQFRQRGILYVLQKEQILKPLLKRWGWEKVKMLPESFYMEACEICEPYRKVLEQFLVCQDEQKG